MTGVQTCALPISTLTFDERVAVAETVVDAAGGRIPVAMGGQTTSTQELERLVKAAERIGCTFVQVSPPFYFGHTEGDFLEYVEAAAGADRAAFTFLIDSYREEEVRGETRVSLALHPDLAPYKVAVLPLLKKRPEIVQLCHAIKDDLKRDLMAVYDDTAAIGKLYRRQDEIGTPYCVTVDFDSLEDQAVTVRDRDTMGQERLPIAALPGYLAAKLGA